MLSVRRRRSRASRFPWRWALGGLALLIGAAVVAGIAFAGSPAQLADGVKIAGVDVGGMTPAEARQELVRRFTAVQRTPVTFTAAGHRFRLLAVNLGIEPDFAAAVEAARRDGEGFAPFRGYKRLQLRFFADNVQPRVASWPDAVRLKVGELAAAVDGRPREAALVRHGLQIDLVAGQTGASLDRTVAAQEIVAALGSLDRSATIALPVRTTTPSVRAADLRPALRKARLALTAPVRLVLGATAYRLPRWRLATLLALPAGGSKVLRIGGPAADRYFAQLERTVELRPVDAQFAVSGPKVKIVPGKPGVGLDVPASADAVLAAATTPGGTREAHLVSQQIAPARTTVDAQKMGIVGLVSSYETIYGGVPNRLHNVQLVAHLIDDKLIQPGEEFSFNKTTGDRSAAKGFLEAPVIVNGELSTGLGGGVCQVSTTVFNAAFEAGLSITERTNHALYISHYPLGRDATVDYPNVDLKFVNDTGHWLLLRTFVGSSSLVVSLYGTPTHRRIEVDTAPLRVVGPPAVQKVKDPALKPGTTEVVDYGVPAQSTSVRRRVFAPSGKLLYDTTWYSNYRAEPKIVDVGPKKKKPKPAATTTTVPLLPPMLTPH